MSSSHEEDQLTKNSAELQNNNEQSNTITDNIVNKLKSMDGQSKVFLFFGFMTFLALIAPIFGIIAGPQLNNWFTSYTEYEIRAACN